MSVTTDAARGRIRELEIALRRLVEGKGDCVTHGNLPYQGRPWCWKHHNALPCPIGEGRRLLGMAGATEGR